MADLRGNLKDHLQKLAAGRDLTTGEAAAAMEAMVSGEATAAQAGAIVGLLRAKGEVLAEAAGFAQRLQERTARIELGVRPEALVELAIGNDKPGLIPIEAGAALVAAAAGVKVVAQLTGAGGEHARETLAALGVGVDPIEAVLRRSMQEVGIALVPADDFGDPLGNLDALRRELGFRNILHTLRAIVSPAGAHRHVVGAQSEKLADLLASALAKIGASYAMVVSGLDGIDALTTTGKAKLCEIQSGRVAASYIQPEAFGLKRAAPGAYQARTPADGATLLTEVVSGKLGPARDVIVVNAAAAIRVGGFASSFDKAVEVAKRTLASGRPKELLERLMSLSTG